MENNKNKKSVKFQGDMLNFCDFIRLFFHVRNHENLRRHHFIKEFAALEAQHHFRRFHPIEAQQY